MSRTRSLIAAGVFLAACNPTSMAPPPDASPDVAPDVAPDVSPDVAPDIALDMPPEAATDARAEVGLDARPDAQPADASNDLGLDATADVVRDAPADVRADATLDAPGDAPGDGGGPVSIQILHFSDWHGQIDSLTANRPAGDGGTTSESIGGAAVLAAYFARDRMANPNTLTVTGGDEFGASPPLASFFEEEPAVLALNAMGLRFSALGNHNFDRGVMHLQSMIGRATYRYLASNLNGLEANLSMVDTSTIVTVGGLRVALIGITNADAASLTSPGRLGTITVADPAASAMARLAAIRPMRPHLTIALCHLGATGRDAMGNPTGPLLDFARAVSGFDAILGDHTDVLVNTTINNQLVVENRSKGLSYARVRLTVNTATGAVTERSAQIVDPWARDVTPDPAVTAAVEPFRTRLRAQLDGVIGTTSAVLERGSNVERLREVPLGNLVADALRARYGTQIAFVNGGGLRAPIPSTYAPANMMLRRTAMGYRMGPPYDIVAGDIYEVLPFGNVVVTRTITGRLLYQVLERSVGSLPAAFGGFLQVSGFRFTYNAAMPAGMRVRTVTLDSGAQVAANDTVYTLATSDFTNSGGDGYTMLADGTGSTRELMAQVVLDYVRMRGGVMPTTDGRITAAP